MLKILIYGLGYSLNNFLKIYWHSALPIPAPKTAPKGIDQPYASRLERDAASQPPINPP